MPDFDSLQTIPATAASTIRFEQLSVYQGVQW